MRRLAFLIGLILCLPLVTIGQQEEQASLAGYFGNSPANEQGWEQKFQAIPSPDNMKADMQLLAARPHHVGSPYDAQNSQWILAQYKKWGWDAHIETFYVLFPTPKERELELLAPTHYRRQAPRADRPWRSDFFAAQRTTPDVQRLFRRRRCHRAARLCELWRAGRL